MRRFQSGKADIRGRSVHVLIRSGWRVAELSRMIGVSIEWWSSPKLLKQLVLKDLRCVIALWRNMDFAVPLCTNIGLIVVVWKMCWRM